MITKTIEDMRIEIMSELLNRIPSLDLTEGTIERDIFVEAPIAGQLIEIWDQIAYSAKLHAPVIYYEDLVRSDIDAYMANFNIGVRAATNSYGSITFYTNSAPTQDVIIPSGTTVKTQDSNPLEFIVQADYIIYYSIAPSYYNSIEDRWEIECAIKALEAGPLYSAGSGTITILPSIVPGIDGVVNANAVSGGLAEEEIASALRRLVEKFQGRGLATYAGLRSYIRGFSNEVNLVGSEDPEMLRDQGRGGAIDIYIIGDEIENATDTISITSTGLANPETVSYTTDSIVMANQPVDDILSVTISTTTLLPDNYELVEDTGLYKRSTDGFDKVQLTSTGITSTGYFVHGDVIEVSYLYNALPTEIKDSLNSSENYYINRNYLVRTMTPVTIDMYMKFKELAGQDFNDISTSVELVLSTFINEIGAAGSVELADLIGEAKASPSVDNIDLTTVDITHTGGGTSTAQGDILLGKNEYPIAGTFTLVRWTN